MKLWIAWLIALLAFNVGFVVGAWWRSIWADVPMVEINPIPADDTYGRASKSLMEGKI